jgi:hypothetical protein
MKFGLDQKFELKKYFKLYRQTLVWVTTKVAKDFVHFAWHDESKQNSVTICVEPKISPINEFK